MEDNRSNSKDTAWSKFEEYAKQRVVGVATGLPGSSRNPLSPNTVTLPKEDMSIYGREPATDNMILVECELCGRVNKSQAFLRHRELYHSETLRGSSHSLSLRRPPVATPVQTHGQSTSLGGGATASGTTGKKNKELDYDRHCGVWIETDKRCCRKSITCKVHPLEMRQKVPGRSRPLNELIREYKMKKKEKKKLEKEKLRSSTPATAISNPSQHLVSSPVVLTSPLAPSPLSPSPPLLSPPPSLDRSPLPQSALVYLGVVSDEEEREEREERGGRRRESSDVSLSGHQLFPKPIAVNRFHSRQMTNGLSLFTHRSDSLRSLLVSLTRRENEYPKIPTSRQFNHLFQQQKRNTKTYSYHGRHNPITSHYKDHTLSDHTHQVTPMQLTTSIPPTYNGPITNYSNATPTTSAENLTDIMTRPSRKRSYTSTLLSSSVHRISNDKSSGCGQWEGLGEEEEEEEELIHDKTSGEVHVKSEYNHTNYTNIMKQVPINGLSGLTHHSPSQTYYPPSHHYAPPLVPHPPHSIRPVTSYSLPPPHLSSHHTHTDHQSPSLPITTSEPISTNSNNHSIQSLITTGGQHHLIHPNPHLHNTHWSTTGINYPLGGATNYDSNYHSSHGHHSDYIHPTIINNHSTLSPHSSILSQGTGGPLPHLNKYYLPPSNSTLSGTSTNSIQQMSASLVQQGHHEVGVVNSPIVPPPRLHRISPNNGSNNQNTYAGTNRQTPLNDRQSITHRTQQVS